MNQAGVSQGSCLCGSVGWEIKGSPEYAYHCHCTMCRKAHGAAFGTYYMLPAPQFEWTTDTDAISEYTSSSALTRAFCGQCGSVVPNLDQDGSVFVPAGCHDHGPKIEAHIFTASKAPWHEIVDELPQHDEYPPGVEAPTFDTPSGHTQSKGSLGGSCLCGRVQFEITEPFNKVYNCFCSRCRRARAAAFTTNGFISMNGIRFIKGEQHLVAYKLPDARYFTHVFCETCGSGLPRVDSERQIAVVPFGALDGDPGTRASANIFVSNKTDWFDVDPKLKTFDEAPGG